MNLKETRIEWLDVLRFIAIFMVICTHCCDPFNLSPEIKDNPHYGIWGMLYGSFLRPCVPFFVMMTGMLLLPLKESSIKGFYKKRIPRVVVPFLIWSVLYNLFPWIVGLFGGGNAEVGIFFPYAIAYENVPSFEFIDACKNILMIPFYFSSYAVHMWYIYMLVGLYLVMPFFSPWIEKYNRRAIELFLGLWAVTLFLPYAIEYMAPYFWGTCSWNSYGLGHYFSGFVGYLVLGYYLNKYNHLALGKTLLIAVPLFVVGFMTTFIGFREYMNDPTATEEQIELFWTYCSPNVLMMTVALFMVIQKTARLSQFTSKLLANCAKCGYGIFIIHYFFVGVGFMAAQHMGLPVGLLIPAAAVIVFACSWLVVAAVYKVAPKLAKWIVG